MPNTIIIQNIYRLLQMINPFFKILTTKRSNLCYSSITLILKIIYIFLNTNIRHILQMIFLFYTIDIFLEIPISFKIYLSARRGCMQPRRFYDIKIMKDVCIISIDLKYIIQNINKILMSIGFKCKLDHDN